MILKKVIKIFLCTFLITSCNNENYESSFDLVAPLTISVDGISDNLKSYQQINMNINSNFECNFIISSSDIFWVYTPDNKSFSFRAPITVLDKEKFIIDISTIETTVCPKGSKTESLEVSRDLGNVQFTPNPSPYNYAALKTDFFASHNIGFGGIEIIDRFTSIICYPTSADCISYENELFGQDAHNMATGDFNNDGFEDIVVAWAIFPHTLESEQKINAPINIYLNDGSGNLYHDTNIYASGEAPKHPFAYRLAVADFNNDGRDDIFAGSMGIQYRNEDYSKNYISPYPDLLLLSNGSGKLEESSRNIDDQNNGNGKQCNFSHDASIGDFDNDNDIDIFACNILLVNDGTGNFSFEEYLGSSFQINYGNPMSSLLVDLNNDSFDDLVFWNFDNRPENFTEEGFAYLSNGTSDISNWILVELPDGPFGRNHNKFNHAAYGDLNNDGNQDIVVSVTRDDPYYEGAYIQVLLGDGHGNLTDVTSTNFIEQPRERNHHGEGNIYLRDFEGDGDLDIFHSTRDFSSNLHGAHIALNDGSAFFVSVPENIFPQKPKANMYDNNNYLFKGMPINLDNSGCLDLISTSDSWMDETATKNYLYSLINIKCD